MNGTKIRVHHWEELSKSQRCPAMEQASGKVVSFYPWSIQEETGCALSRMCQNEFTEW